MGGAGLNSSIFMSLPLTSPNRRPQLATRGKGIQKVSPPAQNYAHDCDGPVGGR